MKLNAEYEYYLKKRMVMIEAAEIAGHLIRTKVISPGAYEGLNMEELTAFKELAEKISDHFKMKAFEKPIFY